jgi:hypothetical protein
MRRSLVFVTGLLMALGLVGGTALAHHGGGPPNNPHTDGATQDQWDQPEFSHGHMMLINADVVDADAGTNTLTVDFDRCVDIAAGRELPNPNQHNTLHLGTAGDALHANAGNAVVPTDPWDTL